MDVRSQMPGSADVAVILVTPNEAVRCGHLIDDRVTIAESVGARIAALGLAAADMAAGRAEPEVEAAAAFLAALGLRVGHPSRDVVTGVGGRETS